MIPATVRRVALAHGIRLERTGDGDYIIRDRNGAVVEATRTARPKVCHALAMIRRHLANGGAE